METPSPPPLKATVCGEPVTLSVIVTVPVRVPAAVGVKVTEIVQLPPAATLDPQFCVSAKSTDAVMEVTDRAAVPGLVSVTVWAALVVPSLCGAKVRLAGESATAGAVTRETAPVPLRTTIWGEPLALSVNVSVPVRVPATMGVNVTAIVHLAPIATLMPQVSVCAKSPEVAIVVTAKAAVPELVKVNVWAELVVLSVCQAKVRLVAESVAVGTWACPVAVPLREILCVA